MRMPQIDPTTNQGRSAPDSVSLAAKVKASLARRSGLLASTISIAAAFAFMLSSPLRGQDSLPDRERRVAIFNPERFSNEHVDDYRFRREQLLHWEQRLATYGIDNDRVSTRQLLSGLKDYPILVLPHIVAFTRAEREAILDYTKRGNGVILMGETGRFFLEDDKTSLTRELGLEFKNLGPFEKTSWTSVLNGPSYLSAGLPRMQNMSIIVDQPVALSKAPEPIAFWLDRAISNPDFSKHSQDISVAAGRYGQGRFVWIGFPINRVGGDINSSQAFHNLFQNIYAYFEAHPHVEIAPWPFPFTSGLILSMDVEQQFGNIRAINSIPNLPPITYFVLTNNAELYADALTDIISAPGSTAELSVHGDNHDVFRGQRPEKQLQRFEDASKVVERIGGKPPPGFRPPEERYDFQTIQAMLKAGYTYILADSAPDRAEPRLVSNRAEPMLVNLKNDDFVQFMMFNKDDIKMVVSKDWPDPESVYQEYLQDVENILTRESLHITNIHSHILATPEYIGVFERFIEHVRNNYNVWFANCEMVAEWWRKRDKVELIISSIDTNRFSFRLDNQGAALIEDLAIDVWLPEEVSNLSITSAPRGMPIPEYRIEGKRMRLRVPSLKADEFHEYDITWDALN